MVSNIFKQSVIVLAMTLSMCLVAIGQGNKVVAKTATEDLTAVKSSPAYAELQLKRTELLSDLESLLLEYTEEFPKIKEIRNTITLLDRDIARISKVKPSESTKLTLALGKLMVTRIELENDLWKLQKSYQDGHPEVKRAKKRVEVYETTISDILN
ncbi:MAG: hypothetical protein DMF63_07565 [Acidobacteria bacterium]|nr:MAG: hypothetical protein DMF63_07565 [Acidobacteriota bacterium]